MVEAAERRRRLFEALRKQLWVHVRRRADIDGAISSLKSLEQRVTWYLVNLDDERKEQENFEERRYSEQRALVEKKIRLQAKLYELEEKLMGLEQEGGLFKAEMEALKKKEEEILESAATRVRQIRLEGVGTQTQEA